ncbi:MAG: hypothetical protein KTR18_02080 [Acidiferrobacterales bacterium]|nr:hypothetical protein [Acidiferrobacterales bacterium]
MRKLTPLVAASSFATLLATIPQSGYALGLGKLSVESDLGEPLQLVIQLDSVSASEAETLDVTLGSRSDFTRANVEYPVLGDQLVFELVEGDDGRYQVIITTSDPVQEAYLHFLVTANWSGGKAVREYTALLDPPLYTGNTGAVVNLAGDTAVADADEAPAADEGESQTLAEINASTTDTVVTSSTPAARNASAGETITVSRGDTLSQIVNDMSKPGDVDYFQALEAVYRKNPGAFIDSNMNLLRSGATLEVPSFEEMRAVSRSESVASFSEQLARFNEYRGVVAQQQEEESSDTLNELIEEAETEAVEEEVAALTTEEPAVEVATEETAPEIDESDLQAAVEEAVETEATLTVGQDVEPDAVVEADDNAAQIEALKLQLAQLEESVLSDSAESENTTGQLEELQSATDRISTLIEVEDTNLANLQNNLTGEEVAQDLADPESGEVVAESIEESLSEQDESAVAAAEEALAAIDQSVIESSQEAADAAIESVEDAVEEAVSQTANIASTEDDVTGTESEASVEEQVAIEAEENVGEDDSNQEVAAVAAVPASDTDSTGTDGDGAETTEAGVDDSGNAIESAVRKVSESSLLDSVKSMFSALPEYGLKIAAGLLALLLGLFVWQRQKTRREYDASMLDIETEEVSLNSEASIQRMSDASGIDLASANDSALELTIGGGMSYLSEQGITGVNEEENEVIKAGAVDPLAEADVYLAYDRDEQAIQVLKEAYVDAPERGELAEKLLEIYHKQDDRRAFDELAAELHQQSDSTQNFNWERVVSMGREVSPDNPLYTGDTPPQAAAPTTSSDSELDLDDDLMMETEKPATPAVGAGMASTNDLDMLSLGADTSATAVNALEIDDLDIDLTPPKSDGADPADAPTLSQIINENVEGKLSMDDDSDEKEVTLDTGSSLDLNLGSDDDLQFNRIEEESKKAVEEPAEADSELVISGLDQQSVMTQETDSSMSQLEPYHESETALELAKAYMELGEQEIAKGFIEEVLNEGSEKQKGKARSLIKELTS